MTNLKTFKHRVTGKYGLFPEHFTSNPDFILYEPDSCEECKVEPVEETAEELKLPDLDEYIEEEEAGTW